MTAGVTPAIVGGAEAANCQLMAHSLGVGWSPLALLTITWDLEDRMGAESLALAGEGAKEVVNPYPLQPAK